MRFSLFMLFIVSALTSSAQLTRKKDIVYKTGSTSKQHMLDVYYPKKTSAKNEVIIFFHGGSWSSGKKDTYKFLGKRLAKKGFVTVIANYRLSPDVAYNAMAEDCAHAVNWVYEHVEEFGGNKNKVTVAGHSAGGHLAAFISLDNQYVEVQSKIDKTILIDPFGLDMYTYFNEYKNDYADGLKKVFTVNPQEWKRASPLYAVKPGTKIPMLVLVGGETYPTILQSTAVFNDRMRQAGNSCELVTIAGKKHIGMIGQFFFKRNPAYRTVTRFIRSK